MDLEGTSIKNKNNLQYTNMPIQMLVAVRSRMTVANAGCMMGGTRLMNTKIDVLFPFSGMRALSK